MDCVHILSATYSLQDKNIVRKVDMATWGGVHNPSHSWSLVASFVEKLKQEMPSGTKLYALGHCFGGKHALKLAQETAITAVIAMHPVLKKNLQQEFLLILLTQSFLEPSDSRNLNCPVFVGCAGKCSPRYDSTSYID
jgi:dienelactone hydrolase